MTVWDSAHYSALSFLLIITSRKLNGRENAQHHSAFLSFSPCNRETVEQLTLFSQALGSLEGKCSPKLQSSQKFEPKSLYSHSTEWSLQWLLEERTISIQLWKEIEKKCICSHSTLSARNDFGEGSVNRISDWSTDRRRFWHSAPSWALSVLSGGMWGKD